MTEKPTKICCQCSKFLTPDCSWIDAFHDGIALSDDCACCDFV